MKRNNFNIIKKRHKAKITKEYFFYKFPDIVNNEDKIKGLVKIIMLCFSTYEIDFSVYKCEYDNKKKVYKTFLDSGFTKEFLAKDLMKVVMSHFSLLKRGFDMNIIEILVIAEICLEFLGFNVYDLLNNERGL